MTTTTSADEAVFARVPTGIPGLDTILRGGVMRGGIYIIQGDPGARKSSQTKSASTTLLRSRKGMRSSLLAANHARMMGNLRGLSFFQARAIPGRLTYLSAWGELRDSGLKNVLDLLRRDVLLNPRTARPALRLIRSRGTSASRSPNAALRN